MWPTRVVLVLLALCAGAADGTKNWKEHPGQTLQGAVAQLSGNWDFHGAASSARFFSPYGVAVSPDGSTVYVGEAHKSRVRAVKVANGAIKTLAGSGTRGYQDGGPTVARFSWPYGVAAAPDGEVVYVADSGNDCIRLVDVRTGRVTTLAGSAHRGFTDGAAGEARFSWPYGVAVSPDGERVYVADSGNNRIRQVDALTGAVTTLAGSGGSGFQDGPISSAKFYGPRGVAVSPDGGTIYVADYSNFRLRAIDITNGVVSTLMDASDEAAGRPGSPTGAFRPSGVAVSQDGSVVLVADSSNSHVRAVRADGRPWPAEEHGHSHGHGGGGGGGGSGGSHGGHGHGGSHGSGHGAARGEGPSEWDPEAEDPSYAPVPAHHKPGASRSRLGARWQGHSVAVQQQALVVGLLLAAVAGVGVCAVVAVALWQRRAALRRAARGMGVCCLPGPDGQFFAADLEEAGGYPGGVPGAPYGPDIGWGDYDRRWGVGTPDPYTGQPAGAAWGQEEVGYGGAMAARFGGGGVLPEFAVYGGAGARGAGGPGGRIGEWGPGGGDAARGSGGRPYPAVPYAYMQSPRGAYGPLSYEPQPQPAAGYYGAGAGGYAPMGAPLGARGGSAAGGPYDSNTWGYGAAPAGAAGGGWAPQGAPPGAWGREPGGGWGGADDGPGPGGRGGGAGARDGRESALGRGLDRHADPDRDRPGPAWDRGADRSLDRDRDSIRGEERVGRSRERADRDRGSDYRDAQDGRSDRGGSVSPGPGSGGYTDRDRDAATPGAGGAGAGGRSGSSGGLGRAGAGGNGSRGGGGWERERDSSRGSLSTAAGSGRRGSTNSAGGGPGAEAPAGSGGGAAMPSRSSSGVGAEVVRRNKGAGLSSGSSSGGLQGQGQTPTHRTGDSVGGAFDGLNTWDHV